MTPAQAIVRLMGENEDGKPPIMAMSIDMDENGELVESTPYCWADWVNLPVRENDLKIGVKNGFIRCPTVVITSSYAKMPKKTPSFSPDAIWRRDGNTCQVSGRKLNKDEGNMGHIVARAKGGKRSWDNIVLMDKNLNTKQGTLLPEEMGWSLLKEPSGPKPIPLVALINGERHETHKPFFK